MRPENEKPDTKHRPKSIPLVKSASCTSRTPGLLGNLPLRLFGDTLSTKRKEIVVPSFCLEVGRLGAERGTWNRNYLELSLWSLEIEESTLQRGLAKSPIQYYGTDILSDTVTPSEKVSFSRTRSATAPSVATFERSSVRCHFLCSVPRGNENRSTKRTDRSRSGTFPSLHQM